MLRFNVGVDVSKNKLDVCIMDTNFKTSQFKIFKNDTSGYEDFYNWLPYDNNDFYIGMESTGNYMRDFQKFLSKHEINFYTYNPRQVKHFSTFINMQGKNDLKDSFMIAKLVSQTDLKLFSSDYSDKKEKIEKMLSTLEHLIEQRKRNITFLKSLDFGDFDIGLYFDFKEKLNQSIEKLEKDLEQNVYDYYPISKKIEKEVKGIGIKVLSSVVPIIYDSVGLHTREQITAFIGLNPVENKSGLFNGKDRLNRFGNKRVKKYLFLSALSSVRSNEIFRNKYLYLVENGHNKKKSIVVIMRKILLVIYSYIKKDKIEKGLLPNPQLLLKSS